jgi:hypothetical protein
MTIKQNNPRDILLTVGLEELFLSRRVLKLLLNQDICVLHYLITLVIYTPEELLEIEGLEKKDRDEIVKKVHYFINNSETLTELFYFDSKSHQLKFLSEWYMVLYKRRDPHVLYIPELGLSRKVTILLIKEKTTYIQYTSL